MPWESHTESLSSKVFTLGTLSTQGNRAHKPRMQDAFLQYLCCVRNTVERWYHKSHQVWELDVLGTLKIEAAFRFWTKTLKSLHLRLYTRGGNFEIPIEKVLRNWDATYSVSSPMARYFPCPTVLLPASA